jgi:hypothetical protein
MPGNPGDNVRIFNLMIGGASTEIMSLYNLLGLTQILPFPFNAFK